MLTPIDIQNHQLKSRMGFYDKKDTDDFIESVQSNYEQLYKENHNLKEQMTALSDGIQYYKQMEGTLQQTLAMAEKAAAETLEKSKTAASRVEQESRAKADTMLGRAKAEADALVEEAKRKADALTRESEEKAETLTRESTEKAEALTRESEEKARRVTGESRQEADKILFQSRADAEKRISDARTEAEKLVSDARYKSETLLSESKSKATKLLSESKTRAEMLLSESKKTADHTITKARTIVETAVSEAQGKAQKITADAKQKADRIMTSTKADAHDIVKETRENTEEIMSETNLNLKDLSLTMKKLMKNYEEYKKRYQDMLKTQLERLENDKYKIDIEGLEDLLESRQVILAESQESVTRKVNEMSDHAEELEITDEEIREETTISSVDDLLAELGSFDTLATEETEIDTLDINSFIEKTMADSVPPEISLSQEISLTEPASPLGQGASLQQTLEEDKRPEGLVNIDTSMFGSTASGINVDPQEAEVSYNKVEETVSEKAEETAEQESKDETAVESKTESAPSEDEDRLIKPAKPMTFKEDPFAASMLGTSFDDDDMELNSFGSDIGFGQEEMSTEPQTDEAEQKASSEAQPETDQQPSSGTEASSNEEVPDFAALAAEALRAEAEAMNAAAANQETKDFSSGQSYQIPMPDFSRVTDTADKPDFSSMGGEEQVYGSPVQESNYDSAGDAVSFDTMNSSAFHDMSAGTRTYEPAAEPAFTSMSGNAYGTDNTEYMASQDSMTYQQPDMGSYQYDSPTEAAAAAEKFGDHEPTIQETYDPQNYLTNETYFGSADNVPYSGNVADFNNGITGEEETPQQVQEEAPVDLFNTPSDVPIAAANDEFAVSGNPAGTDAGNGTPFTFIDADIES